MCLIRSEPYTGPVPGVPEITPLGFILQFEWAVVGGGSESNTLDRMQYKLLRISENTTNFAAKDRRRRPDPVHHFLLSDAHKSPSTRGGQKVQTKELDSLG